MDSKYMELNMFIRWLIEEGLEEEQLKELYDRAIARLYESTKIAEGATWNPPTMGLATGLDTLCNLIDDRGFPK